MNALRIGSRGSALALWQANYIRERLKNECGWEAEIVRIRTAGDANIEQAISEVGGKGIFIKEIEEALLDGRVDLAVHSMKDVPTETPPGLMFAAIPRRGDARDCLISREGCKLADLQKGARVGTSSLRRQAQLRRFRADLDVREMRGNVDTRLRKVEAGQLDAIVLACAGVERLGAAAKITEIFSAEVMLPAVGQGALCVEIRKGNEELAKGLSKLDDDETRACVTAERALLARLEGGCQVPLGAWAHVDSGEIVLEACVLAVDGSEAVRRLARGPRKEPETLGSDLAETLLNAGAGRLLQLAGRNVG